MPRTVKSLLVLLLPAVLLACASTESAKTPATRAPIHFAGEPLPHPNVLPEGEVRERYREALLAEQRAREADEAGKRGEARAAYAQAGDGFMGFVAKHTGSNWDEPFRYHAAQLYEEAGRFPQAVGTAETLAEGAKDPMSRALAWLLAVNARVKVKDLQPLRVVPLDERKGPPAPREPPSAWRSFLDAAHEALAASRAPGAQRGPRRTTTPEQVWLVAGQAELAHDRLAPARDLLGASLEGAGSQPVVFAAAVPLYLRTHADAGDMDGYRAALAHVRSLAARPPAADEAAGALAVSTDGSVDLPKAIDAADYAVRFAMARRLLAEGKAKEAADAFEALVGNPAGDPAAALDAAGLAAEKAGDLGRAISLRERLLAEHGASAAAAGATLALAALRSRSGDPAAAAKLYGTFLERWPADDRRCAALQNTAIALDQAEKYAEAAKGYQRFARDEGCGKGGADARALTLHRAGMLYAHVGRKADARAAFKDVTAVEGATSPEAQEAIADARKRAR